MADDEITIRRKKQYGCCSTIFCLRCFNCFKADDVSILTSSKRKELSMKLTAKYKNEVTQNSSTDVQVLDVLIMLYALDEKSVAYACLEKCKLGPSDDDLYRNDLEFYIPQLLNYLVFQEEMTNEELSQFILKACIQDIYFSHVVQWTLFSISAIVMNNQTREFQKVKNYINSLVSRMVQNYEVGDTEQVGDAKIQEVISTYGTAHFDETSLKILVLPECLRLTKYVPDKSDNSPDYLSCINFWNDLIEISERLKYADPKIISLHADLCKMNEQLPSAVYVPFIKNSIRKSVILNIVTQETKIFSTKDRAPFYICLEIFSPEEHKQDLRISRLSIDINYDVLMFSELQGQQGDPVVVESTAHSLGVAECYEVELQGKEQQQTKQVASIDMKKLEREIFGEDSIEQAERIRRQSPFGHFQSWRLIHLIVKTGDNLKQEQFALQLISQFQQIFRIEGLPLKLTTYEIQSLGPSSGIMQMVKDATTIDSLKRKLNSIDPKYKLRSFFDLYYANNLLEAQQQFCSSLAAYSLVCYFLQIKDRHNGNILLHKSGKILHIDFGFFLSISPGKGLEFEKNVPFKLISEYMEILGGTNSELFNQFRKLFFKGFQACQKHQDKILLLVKMMYSGHGYTLPCFSKGEQAIHDLESRFNPPCTNDGEVSVFTQELINQSLDNWRARWYDKFQYYFQGIFY